MERALTKENISFEDFNVICRVCLFDRDLQSFESDLLNFYMDLTQNCEKTDYELPRSICEECVVQLKNFYDFVDRSKKNELLLGNLYVNRLVKKDRLSDDSDRDNSCLDERSVLKKNRRHQTRRLKKILNTSNALECNKTFYGKSAISNHNKKHKRTPDYKQFLCNHCGKNFVKNSHLERHLRIHTGIKPFECKLCQKSFGQSNDLKRHLLTHTREKVFQCDQCAKGFHQKSCLDKHKLTHGNERNFQCNYCEKKFIMKAYLEIHIRTHMGYKQFWCPHCDKQFLQKSGLNNHILTHTGEKPFKCTQCDKTFIQSNHLKEHFRIHSGEKPYVCSYCGKAFSYNSTLKVHLRQHTGEVPFICSFCSKGFHDASNLRRHVKRHHLSEKLPNKKDGI